MSNVSLELRDHVALAGQRRRLHLDTLTTFGVQALRRGEVVVEPLVLPLKPVRLFFPLEDHVRGVIVRVLKGLGEIDLERADGVEMIEFGSGERSGQQALAAAGDD